MTSRKKENHKIGRIGWLRAAVLGANDGIISTSSIMLGIAAAHPDRGSVLLAGVAALAAGAMSMAAGEYVSVSSQADTEKAALNEEKAELASDAEGEQRELAAIYVGRGLQLPLARQVASQLMAKDALAAHARDELGINEITSAQPLLAAVSSALSFSSGALLPLAAGLLCADGYRTVAIVGVSLVSLAVLGGVAAKIGGAPTGPGIARILFWSSVAMGVTMAVGHSFGAA